MKKNILIIAHPDDETLFFASVLYWNSQDIHVICATDGNADNRGSERKTEFQKAMQAFDVKSFEYYELPDIYDTPIEENLLTAKIIQSIKTHADENSIIFTHGPFGEYGHPHHLQVSQIVHHHFLGRYPIYHPNVLEISNHSNQITYELDIEKVWALKLDVLFHTYKKEYQRFVTLIPARAKESFIKSQEETLEILNYLTKKQKTLKEDLGVYTLFHQSLKLFREEGLERKF
ncbi:MAG: PIG-L family deacetylase [Bacteriovoracaceae bacterium]|nr:PIG-L family deacetylase [Bacteriovoracaceae bacterium]